MARCQSISPITGRLMAGQWKGALGLGAGREGGAECSMGAQRKDQRDESVLLTVLNQYTRVFTASGWMMQAKQTRAEVSEVKGGGGERL